MRLNRDWIQRHIPHQGGMCLLDEILEWDPRHIVCRSVTHRDASNPLRAQGRLAAVCGIEYAAQAMAVHGALLSGAASRHGYLAGVRAVRLECARLDDLAGDLRVQGLCVSGDATSVLYEFSVGSGAITAVAGRAIVVLDAAALARPR